MTKKCSCTRSAVLTVLLQPSLFFRIAYALPFFNSFGAAPICHTIGFPYAADGRSPVCYRQNMYQAEARASCCCSGNPAVRTAIPGRSTVMSSISVRWAHNGSDPSRYSKALENTTFSRAKTGADGGTRTRTPIRAPAPQAGQSTYSSTSANRMDYYNTALVFVNCKFAFSQF